MRQDDRVRLEDIAGALENVARFTKGRSRDDPDRDTMLRFALLHAIQIVGEAAGKISDETRDANPGIPWSVIIGMRHRLVHACADVDRNVLWTTAVEAAPKLLAQIRKLPEAD